MLFRSDTDSADNITDVSDYYATFEVSAYTPPPPPAPPAPPTPPAQTAQPAAPNKPVKTKPSTAARDKLQSGNSFLMSFDNYLSRKMGGPEIYSQREIEMAKSFNKLDPKQFKIAYGISKRDWARKQNQAGKPVATTPSTATAPAVQPAQPAQPTAPAATAPAAPITPPSTTKAPLE